MIAIVDIAIINSTSKQLTNVGVNFEITNQPLSCSNCLLMLLLIRIAFLE